MQIKLPPAKHHRGAALILVLGVLSVMSILAVQIFDSAKSITAHQTGLKDLQQSYWYAKAGEEYAKLESKKYVSQKYIPEDKRQLFFPITDGNIAIDVTLMQDCFNLNSFSERSAKQSPNRVAHDNANVPSETENKNENTAKLIGVALKRQQLSTLFGHFSISSERSQFFSDRLIDWLDADNIPVGNYGAENTFYASEQPALLTANQHLFSKAEMLSFLGEEHVDFSKAEKHLCARPGDNQLQVNINQLNENSAVLISAILIDKVDAQQAKSIIEDRPQEGWASVDEFWQLPAFKDIEINTAQRKAFTVENRYFQIETKVSYKNSKFSLISLMRINEDKTVDVISRQYGVIS